VLGRQPLPDADSWARLGRGPVGGRWWRLRATRWCPRWGARLRRARPAVADGREASVADDRLSDGCQWIRNVGVILPGPDCGHPRPPRYRVGRGARSSAHRRWTPRTCTWMCVRAAGSITITGVKPP